MSDTVQTHPYEILIRFGCEIGEHAGAVRGVSLAQRAFLVSDDGKISGRIERGAADFPSDFPQDKLQELLGATFVATEAATRAEIAAIKGEAEHQVLDAQDALSKANEAIAATKDALAVAQIDCAGLTKKVADLTATNVLLAAKLNEAGPETA